MTKIFSAQDGIYINRLVKCLLSPDSSEGTVDAVYEELIEFAQTKHFQRYPTSELDQIIGNFERHSNSSQTEQLHRAVEHLLRSTDPSDISRYITFTQNLLDERRSKSGNQISFPRNKASGPDSCERGSLYGDGRSQSNYAATATSFDNDIPDYVSERKSTYSNPSMSGIARLSTLQDLLIPYFESQVPDGELLRSICYSLVGTTSSVLPLGNGEVILPENISNGLSGVLHATLEAGLIYQQLLHMIEKAKSNRSNPQTLVALLSFISSELDEYVQLVNSLAVHPNISFKMVYFTISDPLIKLRFLYFILTNAQERPSHEALSTIHSYTFHGDSVIQLCSRSLFKYVLEPFFGGLSSWMVYGELKTNFDDFFIDSSSSSDTQRFIQFAIYRPERVPRFMQKILSQKIYMIGTTNSFLKVDCKETEWTSRFSQRSAALFQQLKSQEKFTLGASNFHKVVDSLYDEIMNYFTYIIHHKFKLQDVLRALCDFLLMAKGDFIESILSRGGDILDEPSNSLTGHQLTRLLHESIQSSTCRYSIRETSGGEILNRLDARLLAVGHGNVGWDVFTLDFRIDPPLNYLINNTNGDHKREYLRVFNHLWKIKRLSKMFNDRWMEVRCSRGTRDNRLRRVTLIHSFIHGFISSIEAFILFEIVDVSVNSLFDKLCHSTDKSVVVTTAKGKHFKVSAPLLKPSSDFLKKINGSGTSFHKLQHAFNELCIDDIQEVHQEFLEYITQHKLLSASTSVVSSNVSGKSYIGQMNTLIDTSFKFLLAEREFNSLALATQSSGYGEVAGLAKKRQRTIYENLLVLFTDFNSGLKTFVGDLSRDDDTHLRQLGTSLNQ